MHFPQYTHKGKLNTNIGIAFPIWGNVGKTLPSPVNSRPKSYIFPIWGISYRKKYGICVGFLWVFCIREGPVVRRPSSQKAQ